VRSAAGGQTGIASPRSIVPRPASPSKYAFGEILQGREKLGLTQKQFANLLGVGEATVSRRQTGAQIQQRALDRFLRVCLASPAAVELLRSDFQTSARERR
jgi:DNA-binding transcriptional regulator YiaG